MDQETFEAWGLRLLRGEAIGEDDLRGVFQGGTPNQRRFLNAFYDRAVGVMSLKTLLRRQEESRVCHDVVCGQLDQVKEPSAERLPGRVKTWGDINSSWKDTYAKMRENIAADVGVKSVLEEAGE